MAATFVCQSAGTWHSCADWLLYKNAHVLLHSSSGWDFCTIRATVCSDVRRCALHDVHQEPKC